MKNITAHIAGLATLALGSLPMVALATSAHAQTPVHIQVAAYEQSLNTAIQHFCGQQRDLGQRQACAAGVRAEAQEKLARHILVQAAAPKAAA